MSPVIRRRLIRVWVRGAVAIAILLSLPLAASLVVHRPMPQVIDWWMRLLAAMVVVGMLNQSVRLLRRD